MITPEQRAAMARGMPSAGSTASGGGHCGNGIPPHPRVASFRGALIASFPRGHRCAVAPVIKMLPFGQLGIPASLRRHTLSPFSRTDLASTGDDSQKQRFHINQKNALCPFCPLGSKAFALLPSLGSRLVSFCLHGSKAFVLLSSLSATSQPAGSSAFKRVNTGFHKVLT